MPLQTSTSASLLPQALPQWSTSGENYLDCVQELANELGLAMNAIAGDEIRAFEESVSRQLVLASQLKTLTAANPLAIPALLDQLPADENSALDVRVVDALVNLKTLNRRYTALHKQSSETVKIMLQLLQGSSGYMPGGEAAPANYSTWSCQL